MVCYCDKYIISGACRCICCEWIRRRNSRPDWRDIIKNATAFDIIFKMSADAEVIAAS